MKVTSTKLASQLQFIAQSGPTWDPLPPFGWSEQGREREFNINCELFLQTLLTLPTRDTQTSGSLIQLYQSVLGAGQDNFLRMNLLYFCHFLLLEQINILLFSLLRNVTQLTGSLREPDQSNYFSIAAESRAETSFQLAT